MNLDLFFRASAAGDLDTLGRLLSDEPALAGARNASGATGLHLAVDHPAAVRLLLDRGADANARDTDDHATPLHVAAARGAIDSVRALLDAGADVHGHGDLHDGGVIGWAARPDNRLVIDLLIAHGARHHIFSAIAMRDPDLVTHLVRDDPSSLLRRRSRFENHQTPVHAAFAPADGLGGTPDYAMLERLIGLGADLEATDDKGRTPLDVALLRGDREAMRLLHAAGAPVSTATAADAHAAAGETSIAAFSVMLEASDLEATVAWYTTIGFTIAAQHPPEGAPAWILLSMGVAAVAFVRGDASPKGLRLWIDVKAIEPLYHRLKAHQLRAMQATLTDPQARVIDVPFEEDLFSPFYGGRQFSVRDPNGVSLVFHEASSEQKS